MKTQLFTLFFLLCGVSSTAQELVGPDRALPGSLVVFEIVPPQEASWKVTPSEQGDEKCQIDTGSSKLYFASPAQGQFTVIAGVLVDGKPKLLTKTFLNGGEEVKPSPGPKPQPPVSSLETWIKSQTTVLVKSKNLTAETPLVAGCFEQIVGRIDENNIKTAQNARTQLQIMITASLAQASPTAVTDWMPFLAELSRQLETELGSRISSLEEVKKVLQTVAEAMKTVEMPKSVSSPKTPVRGVDCPSCRTPGPQNRFFQQYLSK